MIAKLNEVQLSMNVNLNVVGHWFNLLGWVFLWSVVTNGPAICQSRPKPISTKKIDGATQINYSPDGRTIAIARISDLSLYDAKTFKKSFSVRKTISCFAFLIDSPFLAYAADDYDPFGLLRGCKVTIWHIKKKQQFTTFKLEQDSEVLYPTFDLEFARNYPLLALGSSNQTHTGGIVTLYNWKSKKPVWQSKMPFGPVYSLAFAPDGKTLVASSTGGFGKNSLTVWNVGNCTFREKLTSCRYGAIADDMKMALPS